MQNETYLKWDTTWELGSFVHYEEVEQQMFHYSITGKDRNVQDLFLAGRRCATEVCVEDDAAGLVSDIEQLWSDQDWWVSQDMTQPLEGEDVNIPATWNLVYDLIPGTHTTTFGRIDIYGRLKFLDGTDRELSATNIFVRGGEL